MRYILWVLVFLMADSAMARPHASQDPAPPTEGRPHARDFVITTDDPDNVEPLFSVVCGAETELTDGTKGHGIPAIFGVPGTKIPSIPVLAGLSPESYGTDSLIISVDTTGKVATAKVEQFDENGKSLAVASGRGDAAKGIQLSLVGKNRIRKADVECRALPTSQAKAYIVDKIERIERESRAPGGKPLNRKEWIDLIIRWSNTIDTIVDSKINHQQRQKFRQAMQAAQANPRPWVDALGTEIMIGNDKKSRDAYFDLVSSEISVQSLARQIEDTKKKRDPLSGWTRLDAVGFQNELSDLQKRIRTIPESHATGLARRADQALQTIKSLDLRVLPETPPPPQE
jgi:hypothetical protein